MKVIVGITGASGIIYGVRLTEELGEKCELHLIMSEPAKSMIGSETKRTFSYLQDLADHSYSNSEMDAGICSGSFLFDAMVIAPCSMSTLSKLAAGIADNVITRAGAVTLKEKRKLIVVPRETPLSLIQIENMARLTRCGAVILPAMPGFYSDSTSVDDLVNFIVARILDQLGIENELMPRWG